MRVFTYNRPRYHPDRLAATRAALARRERYHRSAKMALQKRLAKKNWENDADVVWVTPLALPDARTLRRQLLRPHRRRCAWPLWDWCTAMSRDFCRNCQNIRRCNWWASPILTRRCGRSTLRNFTWIPKIFFPDEEAMIEATHPQAVLVYTSIAGHRAAIEMRRGIISP